MAKIHTLESVKAERLKQNVKAEVPYSLDGKIETVEKNIVNGEMETYELGMPIGEMLTEANTRKELLQKVVLDVELGREDVPRLYGPVYETITDNNFPREFEAKWAQYGSVVFLERAEGEEVKFGSMAAESGPIARIKSYAAGFEYTKEFKIFNQTFNFEIFNRAFGEAYNALLNHIHFAPIIQFNYKAANKTAAKTVTVDGAAHPALSLRETLKAGITDTRKAKRPGTVLIANSANQADIEEALSSQYVNGTPYQALAGITDVIYYDGYDVTVGKKDYSYPGVPADKAYLVRPKRGFKELVKQDLLIQAGDADLSRFVEAQILGDTYRGVFAAVEENVQEITLPGAQ